MKIGHIGEAPHFNGAIEAISRGEVVAFYTLGVCGLLGDGAKLTTWKEIHRIKEGQKIRALIQRHSNILAMGVINTRLVHPRLKDMLKKNPQILETLVGGKAHMLYPVKKTALHHVPKNMRSFDATHGHMVQLFESTGTNLAPLIDELYTRGIRFPTVTSLNRVNTGSITNKDEGIRFSETKGGISQFLICDTSDRVGSFGRIHAVNLTVLRQGPEIPELIKAIDQDFH